MVKVRDSGMPEPMVWERYFDAPAVLAALGLTAACGDVAEFGCGYGTFTLPAARIVSGTVHAFDIDDEMLITTRIKAMEEEVLDKVAFARRDFVKNGTGLSDASVDYAMLFNILHGEDPAVLLREACRILRPGGCAGVMHWIHDEKTPRGPAMAIRPRPEQCRAWLEEAGFSCPAPGVVDLPPYHYGLVGCKA